MKIINAIHPLVPAPGKSITTHFIYVRQNLSLPRMFEEVEVINDSNGARFYGEVTKVDKKNHGYFVWIDLAPEVIRT